MTGWREQVEAVASVFRALPPNEQIGAAILGDNYGRTGAVALFGPQFGLPYPISRTATSTIGGRATGAGR